MATLKPAVYILHGWTYSTAKWQRLLELLKQAEIAPTLLQVPGLTTKNSQVWDVDNFVSWLYEATKSTKPIVLIGHSNGGRLALNFALAHPERLERLILIDSAGIYHNEPKLRLKRAAFGAAAKVGKRFTSSPKLRRLLYKAARAHDYEAADETLRQTMRNLLASDRTLELERIHTPTHLIWGAEDTQTPLGDGRTLARRLPEAKLDVIPAARHAPFDTDPERTAELILRALK